MRAALSRLRPRAGAAAAVALGTAVACGYTSVLHAESNSLAHRRDVEAVKSFYESSTPPKVCVRL